MIFHLKMVKCNKCGKKIGFLSQKHQYEDDDGSDLIYCDLCDKIHTEKDKKKTLEPILEKYYSKCDIPKMIAIERLYSEKEVSDTISEDSLDDLKKYFVNLQANVEYSIDSGNYDDLDGMLKLKENCEITFILIDELEKLLKIFTKKNISTDYLEIIEFLHILFIKKKDKEEEAILKPECIRIKNKIKGKKSVKSIITEFIKSPLKPEIDIDLIMKLLDKFNLDYDEDDLEEILEDIQEDIELEYFEEDLGENSRITHEELPDLVNLNGHQFESYLKKLFESLGYTAVQTKLSGDQGADLIILKDNIKTVVQAKKYVGSVSNKAVQEVVAARAFYKCEDAMVVTTGVFTKSAIKLAMSNNVELWDKTKLEQVIKESANISDDIISTSKGSTLKENGFQVECPYCYSGFSIPEDQMPNLAEAIVMDCSECGIELKITIPEEQYVCTGCKKEFATIKKRMVHGKKCKKLQERNYECKHCKIRYTLDDAELSELKNKGRLKTKCPSCEKMNMIKKK